MFMYYQLNIFNPSTVLGGLNNIILKMGFAFLTFFIGFIIGKLVEKFVYKILNEIEFNKLLLDVTGMKIKADSLISSILSYVIYFLSLIAALEQLGIVNTILYIVAATIILIILISFFLAVRDYIPNFMAGIYMYKKENYEEGKFVEINEIKGKIIKIDLLQTKIETKNGDMFFIPNSTVINSNIKIRKRKLF
jgi:small conductance mechanosensitive channel